MSKFRKILLSIAAIFTIVALFLYGVYGGTKMERNFAKYKDERLEMIEMLKNGEIKKEGSLFYPTPPEYRGANVDPYIHAKMYENRHFVFFQWVDSPNFGPGLIEGFLYTSTGEPPTIKEFSYLAGCEFKKIEGEENWYFASDDSGYYD
ncbi:hypothetical protein [Pseudalkalibacillus sp. SCS-8]|uniref:hypothetical protein n=1 Tax=Pseudalkalibacillus nanhaiensis TaxID=3115291 RepID=UPI0032DB25C4